MDISRMKFKLGQLVITPGALAAVTDSGENPWSFVVSHMAGQWGEVDDEDKRLNDEAVKDGSRILSAYILKTGVKVWVITEATDDNGNRAATTLLLPDAY